MPDTLCLNKCTSVERRCRSLEERNRHVLILSFHSFFVGVTYHLHVRKTTMTHRSRTHTARRLILSGLLAPVACLPFVLGSIASAQGNNPAGSTATVNSGSYDMGYPFNGYNNAGTLFVEPGAAGYPQFDNDFLGLYNGKGTASVSGGSFVNNYTGFDSEYGSISVSGGSFDANTAYGVFNNLQSAATISGGSFVNNPIGFLNWSSTATVTGGAFDGNGTDIQDISGTISLSGGTFSGAGTTVDLLEDAGTTDVYGTAFSDPFGDLPQGTGSFYLDAAKRQRPIYQL